MINLKIKDFKSIVNEIDFKIFSNKVNFIIGKNGLGKTNILDAINWFVNGSVNNVCSQSVTAIYKSKATVIFTNKLSQKKINEINEILNKYYGYNKNKNVIIDNYIEKTSDSVSYNFLYKNDGNLTSLAKTISDLLIKIEEKEWIDKRFYKVSTKGNYNLDNEITKDKISKFSDMTKDLKEKHIELFEDIKTIELLYKEKPIVIYIKNADEENKTKYLYSLDELSQKEKNKDFMDLLRFLGDDALEEMVSLTEINSIDENGTKQANKVMRKIDSLANEKLKKLFEQFDIYGYPEVRTQGNKMTIEVKSKEEYKYDDVETAFNSSGYKAFYQLMLNLENAKYYVKKNNQKVIVLADEPDKNLHPLLQQQLADYLSTFAKNNPDIYLLITTHSPFLLKDFNNIFYITERNKQEGSTIFTLFDKKMTNKTNKIKSLYTLLVASELYSDKNSLFSSLSERYVIYTDGNEKIDNILKKKLNNLGLRNIKIIPISTISSKNEIFDNATIYEYFSENTTADDFLSLKDKLEKGETIVFQPKEKNNLVKLSKDKEEIKILESPKEISEVI